MKIAANERTMTAMFQALGAVVRSLVATLPPPQQKVFLLRLVDASETAQVEQDDTLMALINSLLEIGQSEQRPPGSGASA